MKIWTCSINTATKHTLTDKIFQPESSPVDLDAFTVGQKIDLQCKGEMVAQYAGAWSIKLKTEKEEKVPSYYVGAPEFIDETTLNLQIASYKVGEQAPEFVVENGSENLTLTTGNFEVISVLDKHDFKVPPPANAETASQGPQPYPFIGPSKMAYPMLLWALLLLAAILLISYVLKKWIKKYRYKRWLEDLQRKQLALGPDKFFYKELRALHRENLSGVDGFNKLQNAYFTFLEHAFLFPVRNRSIGETTNHFVRKSKAAKPALIHLKRNLLELKKVSVKAVTLSEMDLEKIAETLRKNVDELQEGSKGRVK